MMLLKQYMYMKKKFFFKGEGSTRKIYFEYGTTYSWREWYHKTFSGRICLKEVGGAFRGAGWNLQRNYKTFEK